MRNSLRLLANTRNADLQIKTRQILTALDKDLKNSEEKDLTTTLVTLAQKGDIALDNETLVKINSFPDPNPNMRNLQTSFAEARNILHEQTLSDPITTQVNNYMIALLQSLENNSDTLTVKTLVDFGTFLKAAFPQDDLQAIKNKLHNYADFSQVPLPTFLNMIKVIEDEAITRKFSIDNPHSPDLEMLNLLVAGKNAFYTLMGTERLENDLANKTTNDLEKKSISNVIVNQLPSTLDTITELLNICKECQQELSKVLKRNSLFRYEPINPTSSLITINELISKLADTGKSPIERLDSFNEIYNKTNCKFTKTFVERIKDALIKLFTLGYLRTEPKVMTKLHNAAEPLADVEASTRYSRRGS